MIKGICLRLFICIMMAGFTLYGYIFKQNELTELRMAIPTLAKEVRNIQEENNRLKYEIDHFESPIHLMELLRMPEFSSLKYGYTQDVVILPAPRPLEGKDFSDLLEEVETP
ncbi:MAG: hypothetical protein HWD61_12150 [Parachlamydiaceae bacterium]|nr:MAG: hypothetical protein HWD61_12150 [Parachlamydiaceae bacterium]